MRYNPDCTDCKLSLDSTLCCGYGKGPINPKLMIIGEVFGQEGERTGIPFCGRPGQVLDLILNHVGLNRGDVYITNAIKCRPPHDRKVKQSEIKACRKYLEDEVSRIQPEIIMCLGAVAFKSLMGAAGVDKGRRKKFDYHGTPVYVSYHPSIVFYKGPLMVNEIGDDFKFAMGDLEEHEIEFTWYKKSLLSGWVTPLISIDIETNNHTDPFNIESEITCISAVNERNEVIFKEGEDEVIHFMNVLLRMSMKGNGITLVGHNVKFDFKFMRHRGLNQKWFIKAKVFDTFTALSHIDENYPNKSLEHSCQTWLGVKPWKDLYDVDLKKYNAYDVVNTLALAKVLMKELNRQSLTYIFMQDMEVLKALVEVELNGMKVHEKRLSNLGVKYRNEIKRLGKLIPVDNPNSPQQSSTYVYETLQCPIPDSAYMDERTHRQKESITNAKRDGKPWKKFLATGRPVLLEIMKAIDSEKKKAALANLIRYKSVINTYNTFIKGWQIRIKEDGCLHPNYNLAKAEFGDKGEEGGAVTGRLGCRDPNLMNIPREKMTPEEEMEENEKDYSYRFVSTAIDHDWNVKRCIISRYKDGEIIQADADQAEMRGFANFSGDPRLIENFLKGIDIHKGTASDCFHVKVEDVTKFQRKAAKTINFGVIYMSSAGGMSQKMGISKKEMEGFIAAYAKRFARGWTWREESVQEIVATNQSVNVFGRIRHLPGATKANGPGRAKIREGVNFKVQGPVAELTKYVMMKITFEFINRNLKSLVIGNIHDAVVCDVHPKEREEVREIIKYYAKRSHPKLKRYPVPFIFTVEAGPNLMDTKEEEDNEE